MPLPAAECLIAHHLPPLPLPLPALYTQSYEELEGMGHDGSAAMIALNRTQWYDYHFESLRVAAAREGKGKEHRAS